MDAARGSRWLCSGEAAVWESDSQKSVRLLLSSSRSRSVWLSSMVPGSAGLVALRSVASSGSVSGEDPHVSVISATRSVESSLGVLPAVFMCLLLGGVTGVPVPGRSPGETGKDQCAGSGQCRCHFHVPPKEVVIRHGNQEPVLWRGVLDGVLGVLGLAFDVVGCGGGLVLDGGGGVGR